MPENYQNSLFCLLLVVLTIAIYRTKMEFSPPKGVCLVAWRMAYFGAGLVFSTVTVLAWLGRREYSAV